MAKRGPTLVSKQLLCFGRASCRAGKAGRSSRATFISTLNRDLELLLLYRKDTFEIPRKFITNKGFTETRQSAGKWCIKRNHGCLLCVNLLSCGLNFDLNSRLL